jgi:hypothetical protein
MTRTTYRILEFTLIGGILLFLALILTGAAQAQTCTDTDGRSPDPIILTLEGRDPETGDVLYIRTAYVFFGPMVPASSKNTGMGPFERRLVAWENVQINRGTRSDGERCDESEPYIVEVANYRVNYCAPPGPGGKQ